MKNTLSILLICHCSILVYSKEIQKSSYSIKLYNQISYAELNTVKLQSSKFYNHINTKKLAILNPSFALQFKTNKGSSHEIEVTILSIANSNIHETDSSYVNIVNGSNQLDTRFVFRYEYTPKGFIKINTSTSLNLSYGVQPYFFRTSIKPNVSTDFPESEQYIGGTLYFAPRLTYIINEKFNFDVNLPLNLLDVNFYTQEIENPIFSKSQQTKKSINFEGLPTNYNLRFGLVYKI